MADDLSLLLKIRGDAAGAKTAAAEARAALSQLRAASGSEFAAIQKAGVGAFQNIGNSLNVFVGQRIPLVGGSFVRISENLRNLGAETKKGEADVAKFTNTVQNLANTTGKSTGQITSFLTQFVQLESQAKRDAAAIETFGASTAQNLIPQLEKAGEEMVNLSAASDTAGAEFAALAGPIGIAVAAVALLAVGAAALTKGFLDLAVSTAEWEGNLLDLNQQTGVSVETLSALEVVAKTTGSSLEQLSASLGIFQKNLEEAQTEGSKASEVFKKLGVDVGTNTEQALRDTISALAKMPEGFEQTSAALEVFGRGGKAFLAIAKETNGNIDEMIVKLKELGVVVSTADAKAADEFNDQLAILGFQSRALTASLVKDSIPLILNGLREITTVIQQNKEAINTLGSAISVFVSGNVQILSGSLQALQIVVNGVRDSWLALKAALASVVVGRVDVFYTIFQSLKEQRDTLAGLRSAEGGAEGVNLFGGLQGGFAEHDTKPKKERKATEDPALSLLKSLQAELVRLTDKTKEASVAQELLDSKYAKSNPGLIALIKSTANLIDLRKKTIELEKKIKDETDAAKEQQKRESEAVEGFLRDQEKALLDLARGASTAGTEVEDFEVAFARLGGVMDPVTLETLKFNAALIDMGKAFAQAGKDDAETLIRILKKLGDEAEAAGEKVHHAVAEAAARAANATGFRQGEPALVDSFGAFGKALEDNLSGSKLAAAQAGLQALAGAFQGVANAVGDSVAAFALYGSAGIGLRQFTAELIANLARQAAIQAVWEGAQALAMLALNFFWPDPKYTASAVMHGKAAAAYGIIAAGAALAGRGIAGGSFASAGGGGTGGAFQSARGAGSSRGGLASGGPGPINLGSQRPAETVHKVVVMIKTERGFIAETFIEEMDGNNPQLTRRIQKIADRSNGS